MNATTRRLAALARAELTMLLRNKVSVFYAVALGPLMVLMMMGLPSVRSLADLAPRGGLATMVTDLLTVMGLGMAVYYNLTTAVVARRESLVLKRLRSGACRPWEVLASIALPNVLVLCVQVVLALLVASLAFGAPRFTNPVLAVLAVLLGACFFVLCAYQTGVSTRTVESAQLSTMPGILVFLGASGLLVPLSVLPGAVQDALMLLPVAPVVDLAMVGLNGVSLRGEVVGTGASWAWAAQPVAVMLFWGVAAGWYLRRTMLWEPRR